MMGNLMTEYAWVAENRDGQYLARPKGQPFWTYDHMLAIRFCRPSDVHACAPLLIKAMNEGSEYAYKAVEHGWDKDQPSRDSDPA